MGRGGPHPKAAEAWSLWSSSLCGLMGKVRCPPSTRALVGRSWCLGAEAWIARQECLASCCYILERERELSVGSVLVLPALGLQGIITAREVIWERKNQPLQNLMEDDPPTKRL